MVVVAIAVTYSSYLLVQTSNHVFKRASTYSDIAKKAFGDVFGPFAIEISIIFFVLGALTSYIIIIGNAIAFPLLKLEYLMDLANLTERTLYIIVAIAVTIGFLIPLSAIRSMNSLRFTSIIAVFCIIFMSFSIIYIGIDNALQNGINYNQVVLFGDMEGIFISLPIISFAFTFHSNIFPIWREMEDTTTGTINRSTTISVIICFILYWSVGLTGYISFYNDTPGNILNGYQSSIFFDAIRLVYASLIIFSYPIVNFAAREGFDRIFFNQKPSALRRIIISIILCLVSLVLALFIPDIELIFAFAGSTFGQFITFIFPALFYILLVDDETVYFSSTGEHIDSISRMAFKPYKFYCTPKKLPAFLLLLLGIVFGCLSVSQVIHGLYDNLFTL